MSASAVEVVVVGGGPAGAATAALLARRGRDVLLLDKTAFPRPKACAEFLSPGVVEALDRLGALAAVRAAGPAWPLGMRIRTPAAEFVLTYPAAPGAAGKRMALGLPRAVFDRILLDHARVSGARVRERVAVRGALVEQGRVVGVHARGPAGAEMLRARFVVAADGLHSAVARSLGLERPARWPRRLGLVAHYAGAGRLGDYGEMHVGRGLYCGVAPVGPALISVGLVGALDARRPGEPVETYFERRLDELPDVRRALGGAERVTPVRGIGPIGRRVHRVDGPGYLLVGDAAGFRDPLTGEGVYRALRGAELAAAAVERALGREDGRPVGYAATRHAAFGAKERVCGVIQLFLASPRLFDYALTRLADRPAAAALLGGILGDYRPAGAALRPSYLWSLLRP